MVVLFYDGEADEGSREFEEVLKALEVVDDKLDGLNGSTVFVKFSDGQVARDEFGLEHLPALVLFDHQVPVVYDGRLTMAAGTSKTKRSRVKNDIYAWIVEEMESQVSHTSVCQHNYFRKNIMRR